MLLLDFIFSLKQPWISISFESFKNIDISNEFLVLNLDGKKMGSLNGMYNEFSEVFKLPDYFGKNLNALSECLTDLEWLPAKGYLVLIKHADFLLENESIESLNGLLSTLNIVGEELSRPVCEGMLWDRNGLPFHTILIFDKKDIPESFIGFPVVSLTPLSRKF